MSTGMRTALTVPRSATIRQATTMKWGALIAKRDIASDLPSVNWLRVNFLSVPDVTAPSNDNDVANVDPRENFEHLRGLHSECDGRQADLIILDAQDTPGTACSFNRIERNGNGALFLFEAEVDAGVHARNQYE